MDQQPQDPRDARRRPGADRPSVPGHAMTGRARGLRQVRRWSNGTAAALIAATVLTTGYFARASAPGTPAAAVAAGAASQPGTAAAAPAVCLRPCGHLGWFRRHQADRGPHLRNRHQQVPVVISTGRAQERGDS